MKFSSDIFVAVEDRLISSSTTVEGSMESAAVLKDEIDRSVEDDSVAAKSERTLTTLSGK